MCDAKGVLFLLVKTMVVLRCPLPVPGYAVVIFFHVVQYSGAYNSSPRKRVLTRGVILPFLIS